MEGAGAAVFAAARDIAGGLGLSSRARNSFTTTPVGQDPCVLPFTYIAATAVTNLKIPAPGTGNLSPTGWFDGTYTNYRHNPMQKSGEIS